MRIFAFADEASPLLEGQIGAMKRNGLQGLEIRGVDGTNISDISLEKAREVRQKLEGGGLITWSIGSPIGKIPIDSGDFSVHLDKFKHTLELAGILGAENIRLFSFFIPENRDPEDYRNAVMDRLHCFVETAAGTGIDLCHENEKGIYGDVASRCREIHREVPQLKAVFDPANFVQCGQDTWEGWNLLKPYVKYLHIKDALEDGTVVPAGMGRGNLGRILSQYADFGDAVTIEPHLAVFDGLKVLEREGETRTVGSFAYPSNDAAFDAACRAFKQLL